MKEIDEIWTGADKQIEGDVSFSPEAILESINEGSRSITTGLLKPLRFGIMVATMAACMFVYNAFFYGGNLPLMLAILLLLALTVVLILYLWSQVRQLRRMDLLDLNLHDLLIHKISYLNSRYNWAMHGVSLSIVLATFTINLTIENPDGIFEMRKILILSVFYLFAYLFTYGLIKLSLRVVDKQLKNALFNLEEQTLRDLDGELRKHRRLNRVIAIGFLVLVLTGIAFMLFTIS